MPRYFLHGTRLAAMEREMMLVPGFSPRGGGQYYSDYRYKAQDVDCHFCSHWIKRKCDLPSCPWIAERIMAGVVDYFELITNCFCAQTSLAFLARLDRLYDRWSGRFFCDDDHSNRYDFCRVFNLGYKAQFTNLQFAAMFLLTADRDLWMRSRNAITSEGIRFSDICVRGISMENYAFIQAAKSICGISDGLTISDLASVEVVNDEVFEIVVHALLLAYYGCGVFAIEHCYQA